MLVYLPTGTGFMREPNLLLLRAVSIFASEPRAIDSKTNESPNPNALIAVQPVAAECTSLCVVGPEFRYKIQARIDPSFRLPKDENDDGTRLRLRLRPHEPVQGTLPPPSEFLLPHWLAADWKAHKTTFELRQSPQAAVGTEYNKLFTLAF